jgi:hypothetical protein
MIVTAAGGWAPRARHEIAQALMPGVSIALTWRVSVWPSRAVFTG